MLDSNRGFDTTGILILSSAGRDIVIGGTSFFLATGEELLIAELASCS